MHHPQKALLEEFQIAINHLVSTVPDDIKQEAQTIHDNLLADQSADESMITRAFYEVGVKEYPYRRAYEELVHTKEEGKLNSMVLEHVEPNVKVVIEPFLKDGVSVDDLAHSDVLAEKLTPEQIYQVIDGIAVANAKLGEAIKTHASADTVAFEKLVKKWKDHAGEVEDKIDALLALASQGDEQQAAEIKERVRTLREGFLVTEQDPDMKEVEEEIHYWKEAFTQED